MSEEEMQLMKKKTLIDLINREIDQIESEQKRPGWTPWALFGALATLSWLLTKEMPLKNVSWQDIGLIFLTLNLTVEGIRFYSSVLAVQNGRASEEPRFVLSPLFGHARMYMLIILIQSSLLFYISIYLKQRILPITKISTWILLGTTIIAGLAAFISSFCRIPYPKFQKAKWHIWGLLPFMVLTVVSLFGYWSALVPAFIMYGQSDIRIATILTLVVYVFILLADVRTTSPILASLVSIRRDLALDRMDINSATRQLDIALSGMQVEDLLQENVKEILDYLNAMNKFSREIIHSFETIESFIPEVPSELNKPEHSKDREAIRALVKTSKDYSISMSPLREKLDKSIRKFSIKAKSIALMDARAAKGIDEVTKKIDEAQKDAGNLLAATEDQLKKVEAKIDAI